MQENLFFKVWRNQFLNFLIFKEIILLNNHISVRSYSYKELEELKKYKYLGYLKSISIELGEKGKDSFKTVREFIYNHLPDNVNSLRVKGDLFRFFKDLIIPKSITELIVNDDIISKGFKISNDFFKCPSNITSLTIPFCFDQPFTPFISNYTNLKSLYFPHTKLTSTIKPGDLPSSLTKLTLSSSYVPDDLPPLLPGVIPNNVKQLELSFFFNQKLLPGSLPSNLEKLYIGRYIGQFDQNVIPLEFLTCFIFDSRCNYKFSFINCNFQNATKLKEIVLPGQVDNSDLLLPINLEKLTCGGIGLPNFNNCNKLRTLLITHDEDNYNPISIKDMIMLSNSQTLKSTLTRFSFAPRDIDLDNNDEKTYLLNNVLNNLSSLTCLRLFGYSSVINSIIIPSNITSLKLDSLYQHYSNDQLKFNQLIHLKSLKIGILDDDEIDENYFPNSLEHLTITSIEMENPSINLLPRNLLSFSIDQSNIPISLPSTLKLFEGNRVKLNLEWYKNCFESIETIILKANGKIDSPLPPNLKSLFVSNSNKKIINDINYYNLTSFKVFDSNTNTKKFKKLQFK